MNMVRHDDIAADDKVIADAHCFKGMLEEFPRCGCAEMRKSMVTAEDEVKTAALLVPNKALRHGFILYPRSMIRSRDNERRRGEVLRLPHLRIEMWATQSYGW